MRAAFIPNGSLSTSCAWISQHLREAFVSALTYRSNVDTHAELLLHAQSTTTLLFYLSALDVNAGILAHEANPIY
jgi:hypothetical protein